MQIPDQPDAPATESGAEVGWRFFVAIFLWVALIPLLALFVATAPQSLSALFPIPFFGYVAPAALQISAFWRLVWITAIAVVLVIGALIARRALAFLLAVGIAVAAGLGALAFYPSVASAVNPAEQSVNQEDRDQSPLPCRCSSGGDCDCPGG